MKKLLFLTFSLLIFSNNNAGEEFYDIDEGCAAEETYTQESTNQIRNDDGVITTLITRIFFKKNKNGEFEATEIERTFIRPEGRAIWINKAKNDTLYNQVALGEPLNASINKKPVTPTRLTAASPFTELDKLPKPIAQRKS